MMRTQDDVTRDILGKIRVIQENANSTTTLKLLNEEVEKSNDAIAITDEPKFGQNALTNQIQHLYLQYLLKLLIYRLQLFAKLAGSLFQFGKNRVRRTLAKLTHHIQNI